jgi:hypothetical protein
MILKNPNRKIRRGVLCILGVLVLRSSVSQNSNFSTTKEYQPQRIYFLKRSTEFSKGTEFTDSIIKIAFKESECDKLCAVIYSSSEEIKKDPLLSLKRYKKLVDYISKQNVVTEPFYIYYIYMPEQEKGSSNSAILDLPFVELLPLRCSLYSEKINIK